jgi:hypothetical protein
LGQGRERARARGGGALVRTRGETETDRWGCYLKISNRVSHILVEPQLLGTGGRAWRACIML